MTSSTLKLSSPAKINLWLRILGKRQDGFHDVETRLCPISLADEVTVTRRVSGATVLTCSDPSLPTDESNLALKALRAFESRTGLRESWTIHLEKHIPHGAGLGGGSSNAATVLTALNQLCDQPLTLPQLAEIGGAIGSDIPFFLYGRTCDATGRGEIVTPVEDFPWRLPVVLVKPPFGVSTPWAYQHWLTSTEQPGVTCSPQQCAWGLMRNDLERPVFEKWTLLPTLKMWLLDQPETQVALMSGSGSTVFAITGSGADAAALAEKARTLCGPSTKVITTSTM